MFFYTAPPGIRFLADVTNPLFINDTNAISITTGNTVREINLHLFLSHQISASAAIKAPFWGLSSALRTEDKRQCFIATRALHLFLLGLKILDKPFDLPFISPQFPEKLLCPFIWEETIEVITLPRKEGIEIYLSFLFLFRVDLWRLFFRLFH
jgi:hypothetical protein